jgi:hypothetical protein
LHPSGHIGDRQVKLGDQEMERMSDRRAGASVGGLMAAIIATGAAPHSALAEPAASPTLSISTVYEGSLLIKLLDMRMRTRVAGQRFSTDVHVESSGAVSFIRRFDINAASVGGFDHGRPVPAAYVQHSLEGRKRASRTLVFRGPSPVVDPLTQGLRLTATPLTSAPCPGVMPTSDGKQRYDLILNYVGRGALAPGQQGLGLSQPIQCRLDFRPVSGFKANNQQGLRRFVQGDIRATFAKSPSAGIWVATEISADTLVGGLHLRLTSLAVQGSRAAFETPAPVRPPPPSRKAHHR